MSYLDDMFSVTGKVALVTGGATGIGRMAATALVRAGATVMIASRKGEDCTRVADELNALGTSGKAEVLPAMFPPKPALPPSSRRSGHAQTGCIY